eukprot:Awhi_evm1s417
MKWQRKIESFCSFDENGDYFIDRDGNYFRIILNFLRNLNNNDSDNDSDHYNNSYNNNNTTTKIPKEQGNCFISFSDLKEKEKQELKLEAKFYGVLDMMFPFWKTAEIS